MNTENQNQDIDPTLTPDQLRSDMKTIKNVLTESDKNNDVHRIIIAAGNFLSAFAMLIVVPILALAVGIVGITVPETQPGEPNPTWIVGLASGTIIAILCLFSLPFLLAGWGVLRKKTWGTTMAVIAAALNLFNIPLGTALGIYTFWAVTKGKLSSSRVA